MARGSVRSARNGAEAARSGSVASMPELLESSDEDEDEDDTNVDAPEAVVGAALEAADAPWLRAPGSTRARQRQARVHDTAAHCSTLPYSPYTGRPQVDPD